MGDFCFAWDAFTYLISVLDLKSEQLPKERLMGLLRQVSQNLAENIEKFLRRCLFGARVGASCWLMIIV